MKNENSKTLKDQRASPNIKKEAVSNQPDALKLNNKTTWCGLGISISKIERIGLTGATLNDYEIKNYLKDEVVK